MMMAKKTAKSEDRMSTNERRLLQEMAELLRRCAEAPGSELTDDLRKEIRRTRTDAVKLGIVVKGSPAL
jgi:two-component sensor histidine kinase